MSIALELFDQSSKSLRYRWFTLRILDLGLVLVERNEGLLYWWCSRGFFCFSSITEVLESSAQSLVNGLHLWDCLCLLR